MVFQHLSGITAQAVFSECLQFRYRLTLTQSGKEVGRTVSVIMQNPSIANEVVADKSVQFLEKLIFKKGLPEFRRVTRCNIVNQFGKVQTKNFQGRTVDIGKENDLYVQVAIEEADIVLIAWGKNNAYESRKKCILDLVRKSGKKEVFQTRKHPSRGRYRDFIVPLTL